jgi:sarcosine oxidase subunit delta|tara:strand:- start:284 stop:553 length:270 start_codon:yes stop_codon:yes gene_type:complete
MLNIKCPYCGDRSQKEFAYGGDGTVIRPELNQEISDEKWDEFVYLRKSPRGKHIELWHHISGCRQWIKVQRDTVTHEIFRTAKMNEEIK